VAIEVSIVRFDMAMLGGTLQGTRVMNTKGREQGQVDHATKA